MKSSCTLTACLMAILVFNSSAVKGEENDEPPSGQLRQPTLELIVRAEGEGGKNVLLHSEHGHRDFVLGDSLDTRVLNAKLAEEEAQRRREREALARERSRRSYQRRTPTTPGNSYIRGNCTWFVKDTNPKARNGWGDAKSWPVNSRTPVVGAIVKTSESKYGHVANVTEVKEDTIVIEEMNFKGLYIVSKREISKSARFIKGYYF